jgi:hypothetical protein
MNSTIKAQWLEALRSGRYKQGRLCLRSEDGYCCLGVLGDLAVQAGVVEWGPPRLSDIGNDVWEVLQELDDEPGILTSRVLAWAGLPEGGGVCVPHTEFGATRPRSLSWFNDIAQSSFEEIADLIEKHL